MEMIFMLTGWEYAKEGKKSTEFAEMCNALGVSFDLRQIGEGVLKIQNTESSRAGCIHQGQEWCVYIDASCENTQESGGLGAVLIGPDGECAGWFSMRLSPEVCETLGPKEKETIIYELELLAACVALDIWSDILSASYPIRFGDNDNVRFALIRGTGRGLRGLVAETIMSTFITLFFL